MQTQHLKMKVVLIVSCLLAIATAIVLWYYNSEVFGREWLLFRAEVGTTSSRISAMEQLSGYNEKRPISRPKTSECGRPSRAARASDAATEYLCVS